MKIKTIRIPLTDIYSRNIMTGEVVDLSETIKNVEDNQKEKNMEAMERISATRREDGKVFVTGFGWVS